MRATKLASLSAKATVFRLIKHTAAHYPPGATKPIPGAFRLTKDDCEDGKRRNLPALLSVFDATRTSVGQAQRLRNQTNNTAFCWRASDVLTVGGFDGALLCVVADPDPYSVGAGARGHCGVGGLFRGNEEPKTPSDKLAHKAIASALVDLCERFDPERHPSPPIGLRAFDEFACWLARKVSRTLKP